MMTVFQVLGVWLDGSGWGSSLVQANIATSGTAESFIQASHIAKTRHAHQVTAVSLHSLLQEAFRNSEVAQQAGF